MRQGQHGNQGMRQGQQNKRMRGRGRKMPNHLNRVYESNGPDVKIRGTASHIAEKYSGLSRDAHASGDPVAAENYMQHAEHYLRIVAAAQAQAQTQQQPQQQNADQSGDEDDSDHQQAANGSGRPVNPDQDDETSARGGDGDGAEEQNERSGRGRRRRRGGSGDDTPEAHANNGSDSADRKEDKSPDGAKIAQAMPEANGKSDRLNGSDGSEDSASEEPAEQPA